MPKYSPADVLMKEHEHRYRRKISPSDYLLIRLDGRSFSTYTKGMERPFDQMLHEAMVHATLALCDQIQGVRLAYTQSDEISLLITAWKDEDADVSKLDLAFGGVEAKLLSLSASIATAAFNAYMKEHRTAASIRAAHFDSRLWTFEGTEKGRDLVVEYFEWRRQDAVRNSIQSAGQAEFSHKSLHGVGVKEIRERLAEIGKPWNAVPSHFRFGTRFFRKSELKTVEYRDKKTGTVQVAEALRHSWNHSPATAIYYGDVPHPLIVKEES